MSTKKPEVIFGVRIIGANIRAQQAPESKLRKPSVRPTAPRPRHGRYEWRRRAGRRARHRRLASASAVVFGWLEVECNRCKTRASLPLDAIRRPRSTPV